MKKQLLLTAFVALMGFTNPLSAAEGDVTITVDLNNGTLTPNGTSIWHSSWTSTQTNPDLRLSTPANNITENGTNLDLRPGTAGTSVYTLSTTSTDYYISAYSFTVTYNGTVNESITIDGETTTLPASTAQSFSHSIAESEAGQPITFTQAGDNSSTVVYTDFTVTFSRYTPASLLSALKVNIQTQASNLVNAAAGLWKQSEVDAFTTTVTEAINNVEVVDWSTVTDVDAKLTEIENSLNATINAAANEAYAHLHGRRYRFNSANSASHYMQADANSSFKASSATDVPLSAIWQLQFTEEGNDCRTVRLYNPVRRQYVSTANAPISLTDDLETSVFTISLFSDNGKVTFCDKSRNQYINRNGNGNGNFIWYNLDTGCSFTATLVEDDYTTQITEEMLDNLSEIEGHHKATVAEQEPGDYLTADVVTLKDAYADYATEANNNDAICIKFFYDTAIANRAWPCFQLVYYGNEVETLAAGSRAMADLSFTATNYPGHAATDKFDLRQAWVIQGVTSTEMTNGTYKLINLEQQRAPFRNNNNATASYIITDNASHEGMKRVTWTASNTAYLCINSATSEGTSDSATGITMGGAYNNDDKCQWKFVYLGTDKALRAEISKSEEWRSDDKEEVRTQFAEATAIANPEGQTIGDRLGQYSGDATGFNDAVADFNKLSASIIAFNFDEFSSVYNTLSANTALTLNMPADGTYLRAEATSGSIWGGRDNSGAKLYYTTSVYDSKKVCLTKDKLTDNSDLFLYKDGRLTAVANGMTLHVYNSFLKFPDNASENASTVDAGAVGRITFTAGNGQNGTYQMTTSDGSSNRHLHVNSNDTSTTFFIDCCKTPGSDHGATDRSHNWTLTQVDTLTVDVIGDSDFGSFYCATPMTPVAVEGTVYYYGLNKLQNDTTEHREIVFTRLEPGTVVPEGYVVVFEAAGGYGMLRKPLAGESAIEADADQAFEGSHIARVHTATSEDYVTFAHVPAPAATEPAAAPKRVNVVAEEEGTPHVANMTVYPVADGEALPANAMVVTLPKESNLISDKDGSATFSVGDQSKNQITTGLDRIVFDNGDGTCVIYDLQGRKLAAPVRGRVNIINGHKVYVK